MKIDLEYIRNFLQTTIEDSQLIYLINHYFQYITAAINVETTIEDEDISIINLNTPTPNLETDDLTVLQETLLYGIACDLIHMNIPVIDITPELYNRVINNLDTSTLIKNPPDSDFEYNLTFCDIFNNYIAYLKKYVNYYNTEIGDELTVPYIRQILDLDPQQVSDQQLNFLMKYYTKYLTDTIPDVDTTSMLFQEAIYLMIACQIFKTNPMAITTPTSYTVDEVEETYGLTFDRQGNTWCDLADAAIATLKKKTYKNYGVKPFDRVGARSKYNGYGPTG